MTSAKDAFLISVILPNWNSGEDILDLLESLSKQTYPKQAMEIIIVDNDSTDNSVEIIRDWYISQASDGWHRLDIIELSNNQGIASAYNCGYKACSPESYAILRVETDVILQPDVVEILSDTLKDLPDAGVVGAKGMLHSTPDQVDHAAGYLNWWTGRLRSFDPGKLADCDSVFGGTFIVRRSVIDGMGFFFTEDRFLASELEFCTRIKRYGYRVLCQPKAVSYHKGGRSTRNLEEGRFAYVAHREMVLFHLAYNPVPQKFVCLIVFAAYSLNQALRGRTMALLAMRDAFIMWKLHRPVNLPFTKENMSLGEWLAK